MSKVYIALCLLLFASTSFAQQSDGSVVRWNDIVGVISADDVNNPVGNIDSGTFPWSTRSGHARVNLSTGDISFRVDGLVINGSIFSGTPGPITEVTGTLVCNAGEETQANFDTNAVRLDPQGDAHFSGRIEGIPSPCPNPLFLVRIATPAGAAGLWIATGAERSMN